MRIRMVPTALRRFLPQHHPVLLKLLARLPAATTRRTAVTKLNNKTKQAKCCSDPHECKHLLADVGLDVQTGVGIFEDVGENDEHDCRNDRSHNGQQRCEKGDEEEWQRAQEDKSATAVGHAARIPVGANGLILADQVLNRLWRPGGDR